MTRISAYTSLQDQFGKEQAQALAEFIESQDKPDFSNLATKDDLNRFATKDDLNRFATKEDLNRFATKEDLNRVKEDLNRFSSKEDLKDLEIRLLKEIQKSREDLMTRMQWTAFIQIVTTVVALVGLSKLI